MDVTCLKPLQFNRPYFFRSHHQLAVVGNVMKCPKKSKLMELCFNEAQQNITAENTDWHKPIDILNKYIFNLELSGYIERETSNYDRWEETDSYLNSVKPIPKNWFFIHWQNEEWRARKINKADFNPASDFSLLLKKYND